MSLKAKTLHRHSKVYLVIRRPLLRFRASVHQSATADSIFTVDLPRKADVHLTASFWWVTLDTSCLAHHRGCRSAAIDNRFPDELICLHFCAKPSPFRGDSTRQTLLPTSLQKQRFRALVYIQNASEC